MELTLNYVHSAALGYGRYGTSLASALAELGVDLYDSMGHFLDDPTLPDEPPRRAKRTNVVMWASVPTHASGWYRGQTTVIGTMWEARRLPETFRDTLHEFDTIIVPSNHNLELFSQYHGNVHMVPLGVDPIEWHYTPRQKPTRDFRFLIAGSGKRKGTDVAYEAFRKAFHNWPGSSLGPRPVLVMKNPRREDFAGPDVEMVGGRIPAEQEVDLYASAHCYVQPSRGEGFGLQPLQAMAQGCPTILTAAHGHDSFAHLGYGLDSTPSKSAYFVYGDAGEWWEPDLDQLIERMRWVYSNYDEALTHGKWAAGVVARRFTWQRTAERTIDAIGRDRLEAPYAGDGEWVKPTQKKYPVVTLRDWTADIAGTTYQLRKGETYWLMSDVKRILWEADLLDPACLDTNGEDTGLTPDQLERLPEYMDRHEFCQACGQEIGSRPTRADRILAELGG